MGTHRLLLVSFLLLAAASAQQSQPARFKVEGVAINSVTGKPLPRVLVQIYGHAMLTGPEGEFAFDGVPAGHVQIEFSKPGFFKPSQGANRYMGRAASVFEIGPDIGKITLKLFPEAVITGHVAGQDEEPLEGASVEVLSHMWVNGRRVLEGSHGAVRTDEDGNFRIGGLASGHYILAVKSGNVSRRVLGEQTSKASASYPAIVYYPGTTDVAGAEAVELAPGQKMETQFTLALSPAYRLAGKVVALGEWKRVDAPTIIDSQDQSLLNVDRFDPASGAFEFRAVPAGTYIMRVAGEDNQNRYKFSSRTVTVSQSVNNLQLSLQAGFNIPVVARTEFSKLPQRGSCSWRDPGGEEHRSDCSDYPPARVELVSVDSFRVRFGTEYRPVQDPSVYSVQGVSPGKYTVRAEPMLAGYVQSVRSGNLDLLHEVLTVPEDGQIPPIEVVVRDDPGILKVTVHTEKFVQPAMVVIFPEGSSPILPNMMRNVANVDAYFGQLAPGNYKVLAFESGDGLALDDPEVLAKYASQAATVTVAANGNAAITVPVIHNGE